MTDEERRAYNRKYYNEHRQACIDKQLRWQKAHKEQVNEYHRAYNAKNPEKHREYMKRYREKKKEDKA